MNSRMDTGEARQTLPDISGMKIVIRDRADLIRSADIKTPIANIISGWDRSAKFVGMREPLQSLKPILLPTVGEPNMTSPLAKLLAGVGLLCVSAYSADAFPNPASIAPNTPATVVPVAQGCGPGGWRGPYGGCRYGGYRYYTPYRGGYYYRNNGCPPGYWRGPYGACRNTPYRGPLPGGWY